MAISSPFDGCDGYVDNQSKGNYWSSGAKLSSQTDLAIGAALNRMNDPNGFAPSDVWTALKDAPQTQSGDEGWTAYIVNGLQSPFTALGTITSSADVLSTVALYKSAVAGTAPTGALVSSYSDFENSTDGTTLTAAILNAGTHGMGINQWSLASSAGFTVCTAGSFPSYANTTTNGTTYAAGAGTRGICYDMQSGGGNNAYEGIPADNLTVTVYVNVNVGTNVTSYSSPVLVGAAGADAAAFTINSSGQLALECSFANPQDYPISPTTLAVANTTYGIWLQYVGGGMHTIKIYSNPTTNPSLIGTATCPAQGTNYAAEVGIGEFHVGAVGLTGTREFDSFMWDISGAGINITSPGNTVSSYSDFESGSNGNPVTTTILDAGTHGAGVGQWTVDTGGFNVCTSGSLPSYSNTTVNGTTYPAGAGTRGICYNMMNGGEAVERMSSKTVTVYANVNLGADATHYSNPVIIGNFGVDDAAFTIKWTGELELECPFDSPEDYPISGSNLAQANTTYGIWLQYDSAGGHHTIKIYSNPTTNPQLIGTATCPARGSTAATTLGFGEFHGGAVGLTGTREFDSFMWDVSGHGINVSPLGNTVQVSVGTNPAGLSYSVDGTPYNSAQILTWTIGTNHTLTTTSSQNPAAGTQDNFVNWSDGTTGVSDAVTATTGTTSFTASFNTLYQLTTSVSPAGSGTISPTTDGYYAQGSAVPVAATPNAGFNFAGWAGNVANPSSASTTITMNAPQSVTANFATTTQAPAITSASGTTFTVGVAGSFTVTATGIPPPTISELGALPTGVSFNALTNVLSGTPAAGTAATYSITFTASNGAGTNAVQSFTLTVNPPPSFTQIRVHTGGSAYTDTQGNPWSADTGFTGGKTYTATGTVTNTPDPTLYLSERYGAMTYNFTVPVGTYNVTLKFAEVFYTTTGQRIFNVAINGATVLSNFDIVAQAGGARIALDKTFSATAVSGKITIQFITGSVDLPKISAIQIVAFSGSYVSMQLNPTAVTGGTSSNGTVTLIGAAPVGGAAVALSSDSPAATVPASVTVLAGATTATFKLTTSPVSATVTPNITANYSGTATAQLTVSPPSVLSLSLNPSTVIGGVANSIGTVTLNGSAPSDGTIVALSSNVAGAAVPASVLVLAGTTSATFTVTTSTVAATTVATITATYGLSTTAMLTVVNPAAPTLASIAPNSGLRGTSVSVTLTGANFTAIGTTVTVSGTGVTVGTIAVVNSTTITATFTISATATISASNVSVTTTTGGASNAVTFTAVNPPLPTLGSVAPNTFVRGTTTTSVTLTGTNFTTTGISVAVNRAGGITVSAVSVTSPTMLTATFAVATGTTAALGTHTVTVRNPAGASNSISITVQGPTLASISPITGAHGTTVPVTLTGANLTGATAVTVSGGGVTCTGITSTSTTVNASCAITAGTAQTARNVTVATPIGTTNSLNHAFTVN